MRRRADRSEPRKTARIELERYFAIVAALKLRISNLNGRRLSTARFIALLDTARTTVPTLIAALFYDLSREKEPKIPTQGEKRERELRKLIGAGDRGEASGCQKMFPYRRSRQVALTGNVLAASQSRWPAGPSSLGPALRVHLLCL